MNKVQLTTHNRWILQVLLNERKDYSLENSTYTKFQSRENKSMVAEVWIVDGSLLRVESWLGGDRKGLLLHLNAGTWVCSLCDDPWAAAAHSWLCNLCVWDTPANTCTDITQSSPQDFMWHRKCNTFSFLQGRIQTSRESVSGTVLISSQKSLC